MNSFFVLATTSSSPLTAASGCLYTAFLFYLVVWGFHGVCIRSARAQYRLVLSDTGTEGIGDDEREDFMIVSWMADLKVATVCWFTIDGLLCAARLGMMI